LTLSLREVNALGVEDSLPQRFKLRFELFFIALSSG
jgi:hypothetical protein